MREAAFTLHYKFSAFVLRLAAVLTCNTIIAGSSRLDLPADRRQVSARQLLHREDALAQMTGA